jgi:hypothetical protein
MNPDVPMIYPQHTHTNAGFIPDGIGGETPVIGVQIDDLVTLVFSEDDAHAFITQIQLAMQRMMEPE